MSTHCTSSIAFHQKGQRRIEAAFDASRISSDGGVLLLREVAVALGLFEQLANCFEDPRRVEHSVEELLDQRVLGLACGYEDLNDHDTLRNNPLFAVAVGKTDPFGHRQPRDRDNGTPLASHSTLNRLELCPTHREGRADMKLTHGREAIERLFVDLFLDSYDEPPEHILLDVDATDIPLHEKCSVPGGGVRRGQRTPTTRSPRSRQYSSDCKGESPRGETPLG